MLKEARHHPAPSTLAAVAMAKGRVAERSQAGSLQSTPAGERAAGTRAPTAPGSRDHLKGEWIQGPEAGGCRWGFRGRGGEGPQLGSGGLLGVWGLFSPGERRENGAPAFGPLPSTRRDTW